jgi:hypothetical protein
LLLKPRCYDGSNTAFEHAAEAARLGGAEAYRVRLVNALLGAVQTQAMLADAVELDEEARNAAWREQLLSAGAFDDPVVRVGFVRWQVLRAGDAVAADRAACGDRTDSGGRRARRRGAARTAGGDRRQLPGRRRQRRGDPCRAGRVAAARDSLQTAIDNTDILLDMLKSVGL